MTTTISQRDINLAVRKLKDVVKKEVKKVKKASPLGVVKFGDVAITAKPSGMLEIGFVFHSFFMDDFYENAASVEFQAGRWLNAYRISCAWDHSQVVGSLKM